MGVHKWSVNTPVVTFLFVFPPYQGCLYIQAYTLIYIKFWRKILCVRNYAFKMPDQTSFGCSNGKSDRYSDFLFVIYKEKYLNGLSVPQKFMIASSSHWKHMLHHYYSSSEWKVFFGHGMYTVQCSVDHQWRLGQSIPF